MLLLRSMKRHSFEVIAEIDYLHYLLNQMLEESKKKKSQIAMMIDKACNVDELRLKDAKKIIKRIEKLKKQLDLGDLEYGKDV